MGLHVMNRDERDAVLDAQVLGVVRAGSENGQNIYGWSVKGSHNIMKYLSFSGRFMTLILLTKEIP